jgi:hypothetical protein
MEDFPKLIAENYMKLRASDVRAVWNKVVEDEFYSKYCTGYH